MIHVPHFNPNSSLVFAGFENVVEKKKKTFSLPSPHTRKSSAYLIDMQKLFLATLLPARRADLRVWEKANLSPGHIPKQKACFGPKAHAAFQQPAGKGKPSDFFL